MKRNCAFTICARNYLGLAKIMKNSFLSFYNVDFYIFIADEIEDSLLSDDILRCKTVLSIPLETWNKNSFKYDITEFCTYLKPHCFEYLFQTHTNVCYFDPDIMFFSSPKFIYDEFIEHDFLLTPHLIEINIQQEG